MKKKLLATLLACTLVVSSFAACGKTETSGSTETPASKTETTQTEVKNDTLRKNLPVSILSSKKPKA